MKLGALLGPIATAQRPSRHLAEQARAFEGEGFESLWSVQAIGRGFMISDPFMRFRSPRRSPNRIEIGTAVDPGSALSPGRSCAPRVFVDADLRRTIVVRCRRRIDPEGLRRVRPRLHDAISARSRARDANCDGSSPTVVSATSDLSPWPAVFAAVRRCCSAHGAAAAWNAPRNRIRVGLHRLRIASPAEVISGACSGIAPPAVGARWCRRFSWDPLPTSAPRRTMLAEFAAAGFDDAVVMLLPGGPGSRTAC